MRSMWTRAIFVALALGLAAAGSPAGADVITDANAKAAEISSKLPGTPPAVRAMAIVQVSVFEATNAITGKYPAFRAKMTPAPGASIDAAVAAATRGALLKTVPSQKAAIEADYEAALKNIPDGPAKSAGLAAGEQAAAAIVQMCADDGAMAPDGYRPYTTPGTYVPTMLPAVPHWGKRRPWLMTKADQFRPGPPPALTSETWMRDYNEIKALGGKNSTARTAEQTAIAKFWEATAPNVYWPVARSVASQSGRDVTENARFFAVAAMAMDDALIAVFDAKYHYNFWRPVTAIRNGHDGNDATTREPGWTPFIDTPMHPEYPCAHCIVSSSLGAVLRAEIGGVASPTLSSTSPFAPGAPRSWKTVDDFTDEVALARIYDGVHYRNSTVVGALMGKKIGETAVQNFAKPVK